MSRSIKRNRVRLEFNSLKDPSLTKQHFRDECDINNILKRFKTTGVVTHVKDVRGQFGDFTKVVDYQTAYNLVLKAQEAFQTLPADVRDRFSNNPASFVAFVDDKRNSDELVKLGLAVSVPVAVSDPSSLLNKSSKSTSSGAKNKEPEPSSSGDV